MARFDRDGISFDPPEGWREMSVTTLERPTQPDTLEVCTVVVSNEPLSATESLRTHVQKKVITVSRALPQFEYKDTVDGKLGGRPSIVVHYSWANDMRWLQSVVAVEFAKTDGRAALLVTTTSAADDEKAPRSHEEADQKALSAVLASLRFVADDG